MTLAARLLVLVALALLPPVVIQVWTGLEQRRERQDALRAEVLAQTRAVQADIARMAEGVRQLLVALAGAPAIRGGDLPACTAYLRDVASQSFRDSPRDYVLLAANDATGAIICSSAGASPGDYSNAGRAYHQRAMATGGFVVGDLVTGVATRRSSIHFALPFRRLDGAPGGIVLASIEQERLERALSAAALPPGGAAFLLDPSGTIVAAVHDGRALPHGGAAPPALRAALEAAAPAAVELPGPEGQPSLFGAVRPDPLLGGMRVTVALDQRRAFADLRRTAGRNAAALALGTALALIVGAAGGRRFVMAPLARLVAAADRVARGELGGQTGLGRRTGELRELGGAFDRMSEALASREEERDAAQAAQAVGEARYRTLFEAIDAGFCIIEVKFDGRRAVDYRFVEVNPAFEVQTGLTGATGRWMRDIAPAHEQHWFDTYGQVALTGTPIRFENAAEALGRWFEVHAFRTGPPGQRLVAVLFNDVTIRRTAETALRRVNENLETRVAERTAELRQVIGALHDEAREREQAEDQLRQSQKMEAVGQLTGGIAHDFNNMLQGISGSLELLRRRIAQGRAAEAVGLLDAARRTVDRAAALTNRLLAFARRQALDPKPVDPHALIAGLEDLIRRAVGPAVALTLHAAGEDWPVLCDPNQLENVLLNLAINARDAMPQGGSLAIAAEAVRLGPADVAGQDGVAPGDYVALSVADTGQGMDDATRARAFEPFFTTKPLGQGTGLGLSQVYGFVRQSGGFVRLESAPGQGATVRLFLPRHDEAPPANAAALPAAAGSGGVLLVEDADEVRAAVAEHLREVGHHVLEAADGAAALALLQGGARPDALVTDVGLPGPLNGRQVADAARALLPDLPVLFITGYAGPALDAELAPGMAVIGKPFSLDALAAWLGKVAAPNTSSPD